MKKNIADMWIKALTSGKYKQGKYVLRTVDNKFCCLGVLCDLYNQDMSKKKKRTLKITKTNSTLNGTDPNCYKYGNNDSYLPSSVMKWAGMKTNKGELLIDEEFCNLAMLNDGEFGEKSFSFKKIAGVIKKYFEII